MRADPCVADCAAAEPLFIEQDHSALCAIRDFEGARARQPNRFRKPVPMDLQRAIGILRNQTHGGLPTGREDAQPGISGHD
jgi:hypothetical protein